MNDQHKTIAVTLFVGVSLCILIMAYGMKYHQEISSEKSDTVMDASLQESEEIKAESAEEFSQNEELVEEESAVRHGKTYDFFVAYQGDIFFSKEQLKAFEEKRIGVEKDCNMEKASELHCDLYIAVHTGTDQVLFYDDSFYVPVFDSFDLANALKKNYLSLDAGADQEIQLKKSEIWKEATCPAVEFNCLKEKEQQAVLACYETILEMQELTKE